MKNNKKQYTLEEFEWVWKDSSVYDILNQFYYEHIELQKLLQQTDQLTNNWNELEEWLESYISLIDNPDTFEEQTLEDLKEVLDKMKEIKEGK